MLLWVLLAVAVAASALYLLQSKLRQQNAAARLAIPPQGIIVNLPEGRLHIDASISKGAPTVVLCGGLLPGVLTWRAVQMEVQQFASVISFDRPGFGWSSASGKPSAAQMADLLYSTLKSQSIPGPYILVGHCVAGIEISLFAAKHPKEVAGMVFVDAFTPDLFSLERESLFYSIASSRLPSFVRHPPNTSLLYFALDLIGKHTLPPLYYMRHSADIEPALRAQLLDPAAAEAAEAYTSQLPRSVDQLHAAEKPKLEVPFGAVISLPFNDMFFGHPAQAKAEQAWESCAVSLCQSATSTVVYAMSSNHFPQISQPKAVVDAIKAVYTKATAPAKSSGSALTQSIVLTSSTSSLPPSSPSLEHSGVHPL